MDRRRASSRRTPSVRSRRLAPAHITCHDDRGIVWDVVALLNEAHLLGRRTKNHVALTERILTAPGSSPERLVDRCGKVIERTRLVTVVLADHHRALALQLILSEQRSLEGRREKAHSRFETVRGERDVVVHDLLPSLAVEHRA